MKKFLCLLLVILFIFTCFAGCKKKTDDLSEGSDLAQTSSDEEFEKPDNYASVVLVTINPQFRLYLDINGTVLAVEPVNADAKSIKEKIALEDTNFEAVVQELIVAANDGGFIKTDATIDFKITEVVEETVDATDVLDKITKSANAKLGELEIKAIVTSTIETDALKNQSSDTENTDDTPENQSANNPTTTTTQEENKPQTPACKHTKTKVTSASTGANIIDASKLDVVNHKKVCADCGETVSLEKHTIANGKCTACGQSNFALATAEIESVGLAGGKTGHMATDFSDDGAPDFDYMVSEGYFALIRLDTLKKYLNEEDWYYHIPEDVFLNALRTKFVIDDTLFAKLKKQGTYTFFWTDHTYSNGCFNIPYTGVGDCPEYTHDILGYKDNKNGTLTVYYDYLFGGPDIDASEREHKCYYAVEYTYSGASNITIVKGENDTYSASGWKPVVESLRIKSVKKVTDVSGLTKIQ